MDLLSVASGTFSCQTEEACEDVLLKLRWSNGFHCPACDHHEAFSIRTRKLLECKECRMQVSITAGTIMHKSRLTLLTWFKAIQILFEQGAEVTAYGLAELLQINYRSAKLLIQKISLAFNVQEARLVALQTMKSSRSESVRTIPAAPKRTINLGEPFDLKAYVESKSSHSDIKSVLKSLVSIYLYPRFLKCFQL